MILRFWILSLKPMSLVRNRKKTEIFQKWSRISSHRLVKRMLDRLAELNRALTAVTELMDNNNSASRSDVLDQCKSTVIEGRLPNHEATIIFAEHIGFFKIHGDAIVLTERGEHFFELNTERIYDLSLEQKRFLLRTCFLDGPIRENTRQVLVAFVPAFQAGTFKWSSVDGIPLQGPTWVVEHLRQLGVLVGNEETLEVTPEYVKTVSTFLEEGEGWSEERFQEYLKEKTEVGGLAEDLVREFEMSRLHKLGCAVESKCVRRISRLKINAGYDIESFDAKAVDLIYDRFIEVKGSKGTKLYFFWTDNEMKKAKELASRYWIYFQGGINLKKGRADLQPVLMQNPIERLLRNPRLKKTPYGIIVEGNIADVRQD